MTILQELIVKIPQYEQEKYRSLQEKKKYEKYEIPLNTFRNF